jgi:putative glycosyltransferase (TIGR04372 family)
VNLKSKLPPKFQKYASFGVIPKIILAPVAILFCLLFYLVSPICEIDIKKMDRHFGLNLTGTEIKRLQMLKINQISRKKKVTIFYHHDDSHNSYLTKFWKSNLFVVTGHWGWLLSNLYKKNPDNLALRLQNQNFIDFQGLLIDNQLKVPQFPRGDNNLGRDFINTICPQGKFVCLNIRDNSYYKIQRSGNRNNNYHDYRNSEISTYVAAAETLAEMGYTVFRVGSKVDKPLISKHTRVIDYATNGMRSEFLDIFLGAHCTFCISTGAGWDGVPTIFRRPILFVNALPTFAPSILCLKSLIYPKSLVEIASQYNPSLTDVAEKKLATTDQHMIYRDELGEAVKDLRNVGVEIRDLSSEELVEAVTEMAQRVEGTFVETPEQKEMQAKLKHILSTHPKLQPTPNYYPIRAEFASCFLSRYPNFLD